jgi:hypothetical protein
MPPDEPMIRARAGRSRLLKWNEVEDDDGIAITFPSRYEFRLG